MMADSKFTLKSIPEFDNSASGPPELVYRLQREVIGAHDLFETDRQNICSLPAAGW